MHEALLPALTCFHDDDDDHVHDGCEPNDGYEDRDCLCWVQMLCCHQH
jgi:hypothetical protein